MRDRVQFFGCLLLVLFLAGCHNTSRTSVPGFGAIPLDAPAILICEQASGRVVLMDSATDWADPSAELWAWDPHADPTLTDEQRGWFSNPSEAKPARAGTRVLVTASGGGLALVDVFTGHAVFVAYAGGNPHSAALLPDGRIVTVSSTGERVSLFDPSAGSEPVQTLPLVDAHGVVWDVGRQCVWALSGKTIAQYGYTPGEADPELALIQTINLPLTPEAQQHPRHGGHDLTRIPGEDAYFVSDMDHLWRFDPSDGLFTPLPQRHAMAHAKSISQLGEAGPIIVLQATENWWAEGPVALDGSQRWTLPGGRIYKARWWSAEQE